MSKRRMAAVVLMTAVLIICQIFPIKAADDENLYALSAVLMDGETGRVLYGKEAYKGRPNASTTKVMTCILALELAKEMITCRFPGMRHLSHRHVLACGKDSSFIWRIFSIH